MGFFDFFRKKEVVDWTEDSQNGEGGSGSRQNAGKEGPESADERRKRLAKRIADMSEKLDDLSSQVYHLQQRTEAI